MLLLLLACGRVPADPWAGVPLAQGATAEAAPVVFRNAGGQIACPVMGMATETPDKAVSYADHQGQRYHFCCDSCEKLFLEDPVTYAGGRHVEEHGLDPTAPAACAEEG